MRALILGGNRLALLACLLAVHLTLLQTLPAVEGLKRGVDELGQQEESFYDAEEEFAVEPTAVDATAPANVRAALWAKFGGMVQKVMAPTASYVQLINRYHKWYQSYKALQQLVREEGGKSLRDPTDVLKEEYAKVDGQVLAEQLAEAEQMKLEAANNKAKLAEADERMDVKKTESMDFVFRVLARLIGVLEENLKRTETRENIRDEDLAPIEGQQRQSLEEQERTQQAMDKVKRTAVKTASRLVTNELLIVARIATVNALAKYLAENPPKEGDPLGFLLPIIPLISTTNVPLAVAYLKDVRFRSALAVINRFNPMQYVMGRMRPQQDQAAAATFQQEDQQELVHPNKRMRQR